MKKNFISLLFLLTATIFSFGQKIDSVLVNDILEEGKLLYRLEKASWYGTDLFFEHFPHKKDSVGGYTSYVDENGHVVNFFYEKNDPSRILVRFVFDSLPRMNPIRIDTLRPIATLEETELIALRENACKIAYEDTFFKHYDNTSFNFIPLISNGEKKVFILTASTQNGIVLLGNDYLLIYDEGNELVKKEQIHRSLLSYSWGTDPKLADKGYQTTGTLHTHLLSNYISSTDICTLLLYKDLVSWRQHRVISGPYLSTFDMENETLSVVLWRKEKAKKRQKNKK